MRQNPHVRICGGPGSATTLVYPTPSGRGARRLDRDLCGGRLQPRANADLSGDLPLTASVNGGGLFRGTWWQPVPHSGSRHGSLP